MNTEETTREVIRILESCMGTISYMRNAFIKNGSGTGLTTIKAAQELVDKLDQSTGLGIVAGNPERIEADSPAQSATPKESAICVESLEKEGWEKAPLPDEIFQKGAVSVLIIGSWLNIQVLTPNGYARDCKGVSTMQDLRTLERLVNG
jgi:hypothetical protein